MKSQFILILSLGGVVIFSSSAFAGDQDKIDLCQEILTGIQTRHRGNIAQSLRTDQTLALLREFKVTHLNLPTEARNELINSDSGSDLATKATTSARLEAIFEDARENIHSVAADYVHGDEVTRTLVERNLLDVVLALDKGSWVFRSTDFRVSPSVFAQFIASGHWPRNRRENIEVVSPDGRSFSRFRFLVSDILAYSQSPDDKRTAWVHLDTIAYRQTQTGEPVLMDVVRYHSEAPQYGAGGGRRASPNREEELEEFLESARNEGRVPARASRNVRRQP